MLTEIKYVTKACPDPTCEAIWHNVPKKSTKCKNCSGRIIEINDKTFQSKYKDWWHQYDYETEEVLRKESI